MVGRVRIDVLNFNHLYYFHIVATEGALRAAAEKLGVSQSTISEQIRALERSLKVTLFERTQSGLRLTQAGRDAYEHTTHMFLAGQRLSDSLSSHTAPVVTLRVGVSAAVSRTMAADLLLPVLTLDRCNPSVRSADFNELLGDLRSHELDLVVGETEPLDRSASGLECELIYRPSLVAIVACGLDPKPTWDNLALLEYRPSSAFHWEVEAFLREQSLSPRSTGELDDAFLMVEAVQRGGFVAFVPQSVARPSIEAGRVKALATLNSTSTGVYALYPSSESTDLARAAVHALVENARVSLLPPSLVPQPMSAE
jgi:LysR family transcriptional regulator, transcriptional activator of nhaA